MYGLKQVILTFVLLSIFANSCIAGNQDGQDCAQQRIHSTTSSCVQCCQGKAANCITKCKDYFASGLVVLCYGRYTEKQTSCDTCCKSFKAATDDDITWCTSECGRHVAKYNAKQQ